MLKSWNEWGEGNYMEPDLKFGKEYIKALRDAIEECCQYKEYEFEWIFYAYDEKLFDMRSET